MSAHKQATPIDGSRDFSREKLRFPLSHSISAKFPNGKVPSCSLSLRMFNPLCRNRGFLLKSLQATMPGL
jgi:hypothetical protein